MSTLCGWGGELGCSTTGECRIVLTQSFADCVNTGASHTQWYAASSCTVYHALCILTSTPQQYGTGDAWQEAQHEVGTFLLPL